jgi:hypothetical protein
MSRTTNNNFPDFNEKDDYSAALLLLFMFHDNPRYSTLCELSYILDHDSFLKFIQYYAGQTITVPPISELTRSLRTLMLYQYYVIEKMDWKEAISKAGFELTEGYTAQRLLISFKKAAEKYKLGDVLNGTVPDSKS